MANFTIIRKTKTKVDQYKVLIQIMCMMNDVKISDTYMTVLAYFMHYGMSEETDAFIMESNMFKSSQQLRNCKDQLMKAGFLTRGDMYKTYELNMDKSKLEKIPEKLVLEIILDNK